ncbi:RNA-binding protein 39 [Culicoides brevitarsis]|uniref:RNA-binding protein 39 n=1 Tax=Culicoides brevitarsis TaxID=469753 RepID=UPI00307C04C3
MAEDFDIEALLEAPYRKKEEGSESNIKNADIENEFSISRSRSKSRGHSRPREKNKSKKHHKEKHRSRSRSRGKSKKEQRSRSKERKRDRSRSVEREKKRDRRSPFRRDRGERDRDRDKRRRSRSPTPTRFRKGRTRSPPLRYRRGRTPPNSASYRGRTRSPPEELSPEERDSRTVFCMQLSQRIRARELEEFFSSVGKVRDVRLIMCNKTKRFKGIAYIEFRDPQSVALALGLSGQKLLGIPIVVQHTQAEKNRLANPPPPPPVKNYTGPMRLYVGSLHFNITEDMLRGIFEPFGEIDNIQLIMDTETGRSKGYGFITYHNADDAKKALEQLNGFELAGRPMKVGNVTERLDIEKSHNNLDIDEMDRSGIDLGATGRLQLMFKLAEGAGLPIPKAAADALLATAPQIPSTVQNQQPISAPIATQCFMLANMFDPATESNTNWAEEIRDDVIEECTKHGGVLHVYVDTAAPTGNVYVKCPSISTAVLSVNSLHGRWFAGRIISAGYVSLVNYHALFPDSASATQLLQTVRSS